MELLVFVSCIFCRHSIARNCPGLLKIYHSIFSYMVCIFSPWQSHHLDEMILKSMVQVLKTWIFLSNISELNNYTNKKKWMFLKWFFFLLFVPSILEMGNLAKGKYFRLEGHLQTLGVRQLTVSHLTAVWTSHKISNPQIKLLFQIRIKESADFCQLQLSLLLIWVL